MTYTISFAPKYSSGAVLGYWIEIVIAAAIFFSVN